jgi:hypothetical protein
MVIVTFVKGYQLASWRSPDSYGNVYRDERGEILNARFRLG